MMPNASECLVGGVAIVLASWIAVGAILHWPALLGLRRVAEIRSRFGERAAVAILLAVAAMLFGLGVMILVGARPAYARAAVSTKAAPTITSRPPLGLARRHR